MRPRLLPVLVLALAGFADRSAAASGLTITVTDLRSADGFVMISVADSAAGWDGDAPAVVRARVPATTGAVSHTFPELPPGTYAVQVMHDENGNGQLDTNFIGIPVEGYGFSRNPEVMRKATFEEARFELSADGEPVVVRLR